MDGLFQSAGYSEHTISLFGFISFTLFIFHTSQVQISYMCRCPGEVNLTALHPSQAIICTTSIKLYSRLS